MVLLLLKSSPFVLPYTETFTGADGSAWPSWWTSATGGSATIQANKGRTTSPAGAYPARREDLSAMPPTGDTDVTGTVTALTSGVEQYAVIGINSDTGSATDWSGANAYNLYLNYAATASSSSVQIQTVAATAGTSRASVTKTLDGGITYGFRMQRAGQVLNARVWDTAGAEPSTWDVTYTLTGTPLAGFVTLAGAGGAVANTYSFDWDNLTVAPPPSGFSGGGSLLGTGALVASGSPGSAATAAATGSGTLSAAATPAVRTSAPLSGSGALTAAATVAVSATAALPGSGALTASVAPNFPASVALSGAGSLAVNSAPAAANTVALSSAGTMGGAATPAVAGTTAPAGAGTLTAASTVTLAGSVQLAAAGNLTAAVAPAFAPAVSLASSGTLAADAIIAAAGTAALTGTGTFAGGSAAPAPDPAAGFSVTLPDTSTHPALGVVGLTYDGTRTYAGWIQQGQPVLAFPVATTF